MGSCQAFLRSELNVLARSAKSCGQARSTAAAVQVNMEQRKEGLTPINSGRENRLKPQQSLTVQDRKSASAHSPASLLREEVNHKDKQCLEDRGRSKVRHGLD